MYRSAVLATLAIGITFALLTAELQPAERVWRIGYLGGGSRERLVHVVEALESGLRDLGYVEGRNAVFEHRFADGRLERLPDLAAEMVRIQLDVIVAGNPQIVAVKQATTTSRSSWSPCPIQSIEDWSPASRGRAGTSRDSPLPPRPSIGADACNCSGRSLPACRGWPRSGLLLSPGGRRIFSERRRPLGS